MIEEALTQKLKTITPKVFPIKAPADEEGPLVIYQRSSTSRLTYLSGPSGISQPEMQIDVYAQSYSATSLLSRAIIEALDGWKEEGILYCSVTNDFDFEADADEDGFYRHVILVSITAK